MSHDSVKPRGQQVKLVCIYGDVEVTVCDYWAPLFNNLIASVGTHLSVVNKAFQEN